VGSRIEREREREREREGFSRDLLMFQEEMYSEEHNQPISASPLALLTCRKYEHVNVKIRAFFRDPADETCGNNPVLFH
jgi:hypothetical protein